MIRSLHEQHPVFHPFLNFEYNLLLFLHSFWTAPHLHSFLLRTLPLQSHRFKISFIVDKRIINCFSIGAPCFPFYISCPFNTIWQYGTKIGKHFHLPIFMDSFETFSFGIHQLSWSIHHWLMQYRQLPLLQLNLWYFLKLPLSMYLICSQKPVQRRLVFSFPNILLQTFSAVTRRKPTAVWSFSSSQLQNILEQLTRRMFTWYAINTGVLYVVPFYSTYWKVVDIPQTNDRRTNSLSLIIANNLIFRLSHSSSLHLPCSCLDLWKAKESRRGQVIFPSAIFYQEETQKFFFVSSTIHTAPTASVLQKWHLLLPLNILRDAFFSIWLSGTYHIRFCNPTYL